MGMNYHHFANTFGQSTETRRIMIQGIMYLEFQDFYEPCKEEFGVEIADDLMRDLVDYGWEVYLNTERMCPIEIGMAFFYMFTEFFEEGGEKFNLFDIENNFNHYIDLVRQ